jgi:hypothetical protein
MVIFRPIYKSYYNQLFIGHLVNWVYTVNFKELFELHWELNIGSENFGVKTTLQSSICIRTV